MLEVKNGKVTWRKVKSAKSQMTILVKWQKVKTHRSQNCKKSKAKSKKRIKSKYKK